MGPDGTDAAAFFAAHLRPRAATDRVSVLGAAAGDDDLEAGRRHLALLAGGGWSVPSWPVHAGGRGADAVAAADISRLLGGYDTPDLYPFLIGLAVAGPTVLVHGSDEQIRRFLPPVASGAEIWCQLFSEPGAGSDLAGLSARAERDGDQWVVTGQKTWSSRAQYADRGLLLARTDASVPKHAGITAFVLPMDQAGVDVRPLRQLNGDDHFNEVFLDGAVVDDGDRLGAVGDGWRVATTALAFERSGVAGGGGGGSVHRDQVIAHVRANGGGHDPVSRDRLTEALVAMEVARMTGLRARDAAVAGRGGGPEASGAKIRMAQILRAVGGLALDVQGPAGVTGEGDPDWEAVFLTAPSISIRGGTDEIQRNVIGERVLDLPPEPRLDKDVPFSQGLRSNSPAERAPASRTVMGSERSERGAQPLETQSGSAFRAPS